MKSFWLYLSWSFILVAKLHAHGLSLPASKSFKITFLIKNKEQKLDPHTLHEQGRIQRFFWDTVFWNGNFPYQHHGCLEVWKLRVLIPQIFYNLILWQGIQVSLEISLLSSFYLLHFCFILHLPFIIHSLDSPLFKEGGRF